MLKMHATSSRVNLSFVVKPLVLGIILALSSCTSEVQQKIKSIRTDLADFNAILSDSATIEQERIHDVEISLNELGSMAKTSDENGIYLRLNDSLIEFKAHNSYRAMMNELDIWEQELEEYLSNPSLEAPAKDSLKKRLSSTSEHYQEILSTQRERLSQEEIDRINDLVGRYSATEAKEWMEDIGNNISDAFRRAGSLINEMSKTEANSK